MRSQRGFTLLETLIALAVALPLGVVLLGIVGGGLRAATAAASAGANADAVAILVERLDAEAHSAAAIFTPQNDVLGIPNCDAGGACHEVDFFTRDAHNAPHFWAYRYDPSTKTLTRYVYDDLGSSGPANLRPYGARIANLSAFGAKRIPISQVAIPALAGYVARDVIVPLGYPGVAGGNALVVVDVANDALHLRHELVPRLTATGFSVVVGTYTPSVTAPPSQPAANGFGIARPYFGMMQWRIGPCIGVPPWTPGCGADGNQEALLRDQDGADVVPGGTLLAPAGTQIPLADVCSPTAGTNSNAVALAASRDARGNAYAQVVDAVRGVSEWWMIGSAGDDYAAPKWPMQTIKGNAPNPLGPTLKAGPGFWYFTTYRLSC